jgi:FixJ family two-component response regulator
MSPIVHIVDDDTNLCRALTRLLRTYSYDVRSYSSAAQFLDCDLPPGPGCLLLDLQLPAITGLDLQAILTGRGENLPIIFISGQADVGSSVRAMKAGAIDFLLKPFDDDQLRAAVGAALSLSSEAISRRNTLAKDHLAFISLTPREQQVCLRIVRGLLNKQVGYELGTAEKTVKIQRARVMQKLGVESLPDLVRLVERLRAAGALPLAAAVPDENEMAS